MFLYKSIQILQLLYIVLCLMQALNLDKQPIILLQIAKSFTQYPIVQLWWQFLSRFIKPSIPIIFLLLLITTPSQFTCTLKHREK